MRRGGGPSSRWPTVGGFAVLVLLILLPQALRGQAPPPDGDFRTLRTDHFRITYPAELREVALRAARIAEEGLQLLDATFLPSARGVIDILLTDHVDASNGRAEIVPSPRITLWMAPPLEGLALSHFDEWLELVLLHELVHIVHLDATGPMGSVVRSLFGRVPMGWPAFPSYTLPRALLEGVAVHRESLHTAGGRGEGTLHRATLDALLLGGAREGIGEAFGNSARWPGGDRPYVLGGLFAEFLAESFGEEALTQFLHEMTQQWIPFRLDAASRRAFGEPLDALWERWMTREEARVQGLVREGAPGGIEPLTQGARGALSPAAGGVGGTIAYLRSDGSSDPALILRRGEVEERLLRWNTPTARITWTPEGDLLVPELEFQDRYRLFQDLHRVRLDGTRERITSGMRVLQASPDPRGGGILAVLGGEGRTRLVLLSWEGQIDRILIDGSGDRLISHPAWSPDGGRFALLERRPGGLTALLLFDREGALQVELLEEPALLGPPSWGPGGEFLLWNSDRDGTQNLYGVQLSSAGEPGPLRQITRLDTAGLHPTVDAEGLWVYFSLLRETGWELARTPFLPGSWFDPAPADPRFLRTPLRLEDPPAGIPLGAVVVGDTATALPEERYAALPEERYSALPTLLPRYWLPIGRGGVASGGEEILPPTWGGMTSGSDLLGRWSFQAEVGHSFTPSLPRWEWGTRLAWAGLGNPTLALEGGERWRLLAPIQPPPPGSATTVEVELLYPVVRERFLGASAEMRRHRIRQSSTLLLGGRVIQEGWSLREDDRTRSERASLARTGRRLGEVRLAAGVSTARAFPLSISTEAGVSLTGSAKVRRDLDLPGTEGVARGSGSFEELRVGLRAFQGLPRGASGHQVLALRFEGGWASGPGAAGGHFALGGGGLEPFPLRGAAAGILHGEKAALLSLEWRFPLLSLHRGFGSWPLHLDRLAGGVWIDFLAAQEGESQPQEVGASGSVGAGGRKWMAADWRGSTGIEVVLSHTLLFGVLDRLRLGLALPIDDRGGRGHLYLATGWSF